MSEEERYLGFLTEVTEDIVARGIYTNKGLKGLFQEHLHKKHKSLRLEPVSDSHSFII